ncbi:MAG: ATP-binding cassette domain-containing protein [Chloroflexi bacterium]|nr:ATP-binding cassette domain-containing protein [Chloroflexota bacterium]
MRIELRNITKRFGALVANDAISLTLDSGQIVGVLGENGAGKSTLMKIISGYQPADSGQVWLDGRRAPYTTPHGAIAAGIGMLHQDPLDVAAFTVIEDFVLGFEGALDYSAARAQLDGVCGQPALRCRRTPRSRRSRLRSGSSSKWRVCSRSACAR